MDIDLVDLLGAMVFAALFSGLFGWWIKKAIEHHYQKQLAQLRSEHEKDMAQLSNALRESADFKATRHRMVYERKIVALCEGFGRLVKLEQCLREYVSKWGHIRGPEREAARKVFAEALQEFETYFVPNRIFFQAALAEEITHLKNEMNRMAMRYMIMTESGEAPPSQSGKTWNETSDWAERELPKIRRQIEEQIRIELGEPTVT